jgi:peptidyl-prolyl cis-trans isomerase A (cyclophilin A)
VRLLTTLVFLALAACSGDAAPEPSEAPATTPPPAEVVKAPAEPAADPAAEAVPDTVLFHPEKATETAPDTYTVRFETTKGEFLVDVTRAQAPLGADRFYNLVKAGFFDDVGFFRVVPGFVVQFGLNGDPRVNTVWRNARITDDPVQGTNARGTLVFATSGPNSRTTQVFINFADNPNLDAMGFSPFGKVRDMTTVDAINAEYAQRPNQGRITTQGNTYLKAEFPNLDFVTKATIAQ